MEEKCLDHIEDKDNRLVAGIRKATGRDAADMGVVRNTVKTINLEDLDLHNSGESPGRAGKVRMHGGMSAPVCATTVRTSAKKAALVVVGTRACENPARNSGLLKAIPNRIAMTGDGPFAVVTMAH